MGMDGTSGEEYRAIQHPACQRILSVAIPLQPPYPLTIIEVRWPFHVSFIWNPPSRGSILHPDPSPTHGTSLGFRSRE